MKTVIIRHNNLRSHSAYYLDEEVERHGYDEPPEISFGNICGRNSSEIFREFSDLHGLRPDTKNPVIACVLSLPPGEKCNSEQWNLIIREFCRQMGANPNEHLWLGVRHRNTPQDHVHLEISRIKFSGKLWNPSYELIKAALVTTKIEKMFNLIPTTPMVEIGKNGRLVFNNKSRKRKPTHTMMTEAGHQKTALEVIQDIIDKQLESKEGIKRIVFEKALKRNGVIPIANINGNKLLGYRFKYKKYSFKGSKLGTDYKLSSLVSRGLIIGSSKKSIKPTVYKSPTSHTDNSKKTKTTQQKVSKKANVDLTLKNKSTSERNRQNFYKRQPKCQKISFKPNNNKDEYKLRESALTSGALAKEMKSDPSTADKRYVTMALKQHTKFSKETFALDKDISWKSLDIHIIKKLLNHGFSEKQVANAVRRYSPEAIKDGQKAEVYAKELVKEVVDSMPKSKKDRGYFNNDLSM